MRQVILNTGWPMSPWQVTKFIWDQVWPYLAVLPVILMTRYAANSWLRKRFG